METAQTADYALLVLLEIQSTGSASISQITSRLGLSRSVAQRVVTTLHRRGLLLRAKGGIYALGPGLIALAENIPHELVGIAAPHLGKLAAATHETIVLAVREGDECVVKAQSSGQAGPLRVEYGTDFRHPLEVGASGLAILAWLPESEREQFTPLPTGIDLGQIREAGYALSEGRLREHMVGVAAPLFDDADVVIGSVAIIAPSARHAGLDAHIDELRKTARLINQSFAEYRARSGIPQATETAVTRG